MTWFLLIVAGGLLALGLWWVGTNNRLVAGRNAYRNAFAQIDVQLTRRHDLIPNLVETARVYMAHERDTLEAVIRARSAAVAGLGAAKAAPGEPAAMAQLAGAEGQLAGALSRLLVTVEAYPDLKASTTMQQLAEELGSTENRLAFARQAYNDAVMAYNNRREMFPGSLVASQGGFVPAALLEIAADEAHKRLAPRVQF